jgi:hypothetical protein
MIKMGTNRHDVEMHDQAVREAESRWHVDEMGREHDLAAMTEAQRRALVDGPADGPADAPTFDLHDETSLLFAFATDGFGYIYLLDNQRRVIARDTPADESHAAHLITMRWLLEQTR